MALSLSLSEPRPFRFGLVFSLPFNALLLNTAKAQMRVPNDIDGNIQEQKETGQARDKLQAFLTDIAAKSPPIGDERVRSGSDLAGTDMAVMSD